MESFDYLSEIKFGAKKYASTDAFCGIGEAIDVSK